MTADLQLAPEEIALLYGHDYFHGAEYGDYVEEKPALQSNFAGRLEEIKALPGVTSTSTLYEIGCAYGFFLELAQPHFAATAGIDISAAAAHHARTKLDLNVTCGNFIHDPLPFSPDVICMWDVIEHLDRPDLVLAKAGDSVSPGGYICVTTGDVGSLTARLRGPKWRMIHPPTHLHYFNSRNLARLLQRSGFEPVSTAYPPVLRTVGAMLHGAVKLRMGADRLYSLLSLLPGQGVSIPINFHDIMFMIGRKV
ncbi:MAG: hypothetical protein COW30_15020 [Rhodospirillales bacterium CG15_BIG_FIL_POST_REV_8_21_14_020_66_15]|nr:MAG: hypothetical protein COW30_15020 [Rhodospirillales bacterium CG15_BIG_FIL_POST_REV_8_21_14_020_66_15]